MSIMSPSDIIASVSKRFAHARDAGDLLYFPSTAIKHEELGVEFEIILCPALQNKSTVSPPDPVNNLTTETIPETEKQGTDPFAPPYNANLYIGDLQGDSGEEYAILLNKYAVILNHFLLVTKEFQSQASPLMPSELVQTYLLLSAARKAEKPFFAFYNCGDNSGASQPHKHIQFIPVEHDGPPIERLARSVNLEKPDKAFSLAKLPYANYILRLPDHLSSQPFEKIEQQVSTAFLALLDLAISAIRHDPEYPAGKLSYNVIMTIDHIHLIPRKREVYTVPGTAIQLSVNALGFAGMLLARNDEELEAMKIATVERILGHVGLDSEPTDVVTVE